MKLITMSRRAGSSRRVKRIGLEWVRTYLENLEEIERQRVELMSAAYDGRLDREAFALLLRFHREKVSPSSLKSGT